MSEQNKTIDGFASVYERELYIALQGVKDCERRLERAKRRVVQVEELFASRKESGLKESGE